VFYLSFSTNIQNHLPEIFILQNLILRTRSAVLAQLLNLLVFSFPSNRICQIKMICINNGVPVKNSFSAGPDLQYFYMIHRGGRTVDMRVPGLPIRDCARGCNNCVHTRAQMSAIDVTKKILFERLYLVPGMGTFGPWVNCPYALTTPTVHYTSISRFPCNFFPE